MGFGGRVARQRSGGGGVLQLLMQVLNADGITGPAQSQVVQKLQSISEHDPVLFRSARQAVTQAGLGTAMYVTGSVHRSLMYWTND